MIPQHAPGIWDSDIWGLVPPTPPWQSYHTYPPGYNHGHGLNEAFGCDQLVEAEDLTGRHIETSLWHDTCGQMAKKR